MIADDSGRYAGEALVAAAGVLPSPLLAARLAREHALVVGTDGAAAQLLAMGVHPDVVIGDMDSVGDAAERLELTGTIFVHRPSQEENDLEKAMTWLAARGMMQATVIGAGGGMIDHALNNFSVLARHAATMRIAIRDDASYGYFVHDHLRIRTHPGDRVSLIPLASARLTTHGVQWELDGEELRLGGREGASNRATAEELSITVHEGMLLVVHYRGIMR
ncbi:MAG TPA: thiamine diphosphokinase [Candidatus Kapabacteria bacterium]|nr:thiamine diphosphokinase [Candidatus Kapabacteria bacterium]